MLHCSLSTANKIVYRYLYYFCFINIFVTMIKYHTMFTVTLCVKFTKVDTLLVYLCPRSFIYKDFNHLSYAVRYNELFKAPKMFELVHSTECFMCMRSESGYLCHGRYQYLNSRLHNLSARFL